MRVYTKRCNEIAIHRIAGNLDLKDGQCRLLKVMRITEVEDCIFELS